MGRICNGDVVQCPDRLQIVNWNTLPFAGDKAIGRMIEIYRDVLGIEVCVETGTQIGATTREVSFLFHKVFSVEINEQYFAEAARFLEDRKNITLRRLPSVSALHEWLPGLAGVPVLFLLDAHGFGNDCPLQYELETLARFQSGRTPKDVIVIHDCLVPDRGELGYDSYANSAISVELVTENLNRLWPSGWTFRYNDVSFEPHRGCVFLRPR